MGRPHEGDGRDETHPPAHGYLDTAAGRPGPAATPAPAGNGPPRRGTMEVQIPGPSADRSRRRRRRRTPCTPGDGRARSADDLDEGVDRAFVLRVDVHPTSGKLPSRSSSRGMGSRPSTRGSRTTEQGSSATPCAVGDPVEAVVVEGEQDPVGRHVHVGLEVAVPDATACSNAGIVFSGASLAPPRWANASGPGCSRKGHRGIPVTLDRSERDRAPCRMAPGSGRSTRPTPPSSGSPS